MRTATRSWISSNSRPAGLHLLVDRVVVLAPADHLAGDLGRGQLGLQLPGDGGQVGVPGRRPIGDQPDDLVVPLGMQDREREILQLPLHGRHAEPVRERGQHLEGLPRLAGLLVRRQEAHGAHVVQPVGQLDHQHPRVLGHRDDHLADRLGLGGVTELDLVQLGDAVHQVRDLVTEVGGGVLQRVVGVLDRVVQQRGHQRGGVHAQVGQDGRDRQRVGDVRIAGLAELPVVRLLGDLVGALDQLQVGLGMQSAMHREQRLQHGPVRRGAGALAAHPPGQPGPHPAGGRRGRHVLRRLGLGDRRRPRPWPAGRLGRRGRFDRRQRRQMLGIGSGILAWHHQIRRRLARRRACARRPSRSELMRTPPCAAKEHCCLFDRA